MSTNTKSETNELHGRLDVLVTKYNHQIMRRHLRNPRVYYNPYALALYLVAVDAAIVDINSGITVHDALAHNFTDHLLNYLVRKLAI
jgi:hypothetical protein